MNGSRQEEKFNSWKEIAAYLDRDVRTVQRWEKREGLPVHRLAHEAQSSVYAYKTEIDEWLSKRDRSAGGVPRRINARWLLAAAAAGVLAVTVFLGVGPWFRSARVPDPEMQALRERPLTYSAGFERSPSFSPDGTRIVYEGGDAEGASDIFVMFVGAGSGRPVRVTSDPRRDFQPAWSPDGTRIVFARMLKYRRHTLASQIELILVSPVEDSPARSLGVFYSRTAQIHPAWSPDGRFIAFSCKIDAPRGLKQICIYSLTQGRAWPVTRPSGEVGDGHAIFSPDGKRILYQGSGKLHILNLSTEMLPQGKPQPVAEDFVYPHPVGWSRDGERVYFFGTTGAHGLWSVGPEAKAKPQLVQSLSHLRRRFPTLWRGKSGVRIAYEVDARNSDLMRADLTRTPIQRTTVARAEGLDVNPRFSPDGARIAFVSDRTGIFGLWISSADGSRPELVVELPPWCGFSEPDWSPDGRQIVIDAAYRTGERDVYVVDLASKRVSANLTSGGGRVPVYSKSGKTVYFTRGEGPGIWQLNPETGATTLFLEGHGTESVAESPDGKTLFFEHDDSLMAVPLVDGKAATGAIRTIAKEVASFAPAASGVYFLDVSGDIRFVANGSATSRVLFHAGRQPRALLQRGISISPDERWLVYTVASAGDTNLMMLESRTFQSP